jgi:hypothetical protein
MVSIASMLSKSSQDLDFGDLDERHIKWAHEIKQIIDLQLFLYCSWLALKVLSLDFKALMNEGE